jgi:hypothetical protein
MKERYQPSGGFAFRVVADQGLLVPLRGGVADLLNLFTLNEVGTEVWRGMQEGMTREEIAERLVGRFEVERDRALDDLDEFVQVLLGQGIVEPAGPVEEASIGE